jgi:hypothetical protein
MMESVSSVVLFHDPKSAIKSRVNWCPARDKPIKGNWLPLQESYLMLMPPMQYDNNLFHEKFTNV